MVYGHFMDCLICYCPIWIPSDGPFWHAIEVAFLSMLKSPNVVEASLIEAEFD
jgi:hypothetical protein